MYWSFTNCTCINHLYVYLQECCLCCMRGGALKPTSNGKWAHVVCALTITEVKFENILKREPINIDEIISNRVKLVSSRWLIKEFVMTRYCQSGIFSKLKSIVTFIKITCFNTIWYMYYIITTKIFVFVCKFSFFHVHKENLTFVSACTHLLIMYFIFFEFTLFLIWLF